MSRTRPPRTFEAPPAGLVRMRWIAGGLLVLMAATFLIARAFDDRYPALGDRKSVV